MARYIDGFVFPVPRDRLDEYKRVAEAAVGIWKEHGALDYCEYVGDDLRLEGTRSFTDLVAATEEEAVVFGCQPEFGRSQAVVITLQDLHHFAAAEFSGDGLVIGKHLAQPRSRDR